MPRFVHRSRLEASPEAVFAWHARPGAFERLCPPWERIEILERTGGVAEGSRLVMAIRRGPLTLRWSALHGSCLEGREFRDEQVEGPFAAWTHTHRMLPADGGGTVLEDDILYRLPGGSLGTLLGGRATERMLERTFRFRHARTRDDLARHAAVAKQGPLRVAITGASGLIGRSLAAFLTSGGHEVMRLVRRAARPRTSDVAWRPELGEIDAAALEGVDAVVHLAGENVGAGRWTAARRAAIRDSRIQGTRVLADALARARRPPRVLISASAVGYYGDRGDEALVEESPSGTGFLAGVCRAWEASAAPAAGAGIRLVTLRLGVVLAAGGGALARMLPPFRLGLGGPVGSGRQVVSWIALDDVVGAIHHLLFADSVAGAVNACAPGSVTSADLARTLGRVLRRPALLPLPAAAVRLAFGEMGEVLLLESARVRPARLVASGFRFLHPDLEGALRCELGRG
jgi:uncharacterized protein (TIGR01777 family)